VKRRRNTPEQIIRKLREADRLLGEGRTVLASADQLSDACGPVDQPRSGLAKWSRLPGILAEK
jgi:hypothetical protein